MGAQMTSAQLNEWMAFERIEGPFGARRLDMGFALVAHLLANAHRDPDKRPEAWTVEDFMPRFGDGPDVATADGPLPPSEVYGTPEHTDKLLAKALAMNAMLGGTPPGE